MDPILILAVMVGLAALGFFFHGVVMLVRPAVVIQTQARGSTSMSNLIKTVESYVLSPAGLGFLMAGLTALENSAIAATTDAELKQLETLAFQVINDKVKALAAAPVAPVPAS